MGSSAARACPRYRAPSRWCHLEDEGEVVTVAQLLECNQDLLSQYRPVWYRLFQYRPQYAWPPRRITVIPWPRAPAD